MKKLFVSLFLILMSMNSFSQQKSFSGDLRGKKIVFQLEEQKLKNSEMYKLEKSAVGEFNLSFVSNNVLKRTWKLTRNKAQKLDDEFFNQFLSMKYDMKAYEKKKCHKLYSLVMHSSDFLNVCKQDVKRVKIVSDLLSKIQKEFKL